MKKTLLLTTALSTLSLSIWAESGHHMNMGTNHAMMSQHTQEYTGDMTAMHNDMMRGIMSDHPDVAFAKGMLPHHQGAIAMAMTELKYGKNEKMRALAQNIIDAQKAEITMLEQWITAHPQKDKIAAQPHPFNEAYREHMSKMHADMSEAMTDEDADTTFAKGMIPHHQGAVAMAKIQLAHGKDAAMMRLAKHIIQAQEGEIALMQQWIKAHHSAH